MRTDGVTLSPEAIQDIRDSIASTFGPTSLPATPRAYKSKAKNAQEAHEAIRPTSMGRAPEHLPDSCSSDQRRLYELIWRRTMACQMNDAALQQVGAWDQKQADYTTWVGFGSLQWRGLGSGEQAGCMNSNKQQQHNA
jgi:DNA topoisomerase-1